MKIPKNQFKTFIFDLDGVIVETSKFHFLAWQQICNSMGYHLSEKKNEELKGVSRVKCLEMIMEWSGKKFTAHEFNVVLEEKNNVYKSYIKDINSQDLNDGIFDFITQADKNGYKIALYSASRNAKKILCQLGIIEFFSALIDGNNVVHPKPHPEGFEQAANLTQTDPKQCVVFEDSMKGIRGAKAVNMFSVGIGSKAVLKDADLVYEKFRDININDFINV